MIQLKKMFIPSCLLMLTFIACNNTSTTEGGEKTGDTATIATDSQQVARTRNNCPEPNITFPTDCYGMGSFDDACKDTIRKAHKLDTLQFAQLRTHYSPSLHDGKVIDAQPLRRIVNAIPNGDWNAWIISINDPSEEEHNENIEFSVRYIKEEKRSTYTMALFRSLLAWDANGDGTPDIKKFVLYKGLHEGHEDCVDYIFEGRDVTDKIIYFGDVSGLEP